MGLSLRCKAQVILSVGGPFRSTGQLTKVLSQKFASGARLYERYVRRSPCAKRASRSNIAKAEPRHLRRPLLKLTSVCGAATNHVRLRRQKTPLPPDAMQYATTTLRSPPS